MTYIVSGGALNSTHSLSTRNPSDLSSHADSVSPVKTWRSTLYTDRPCLCTSTSYTTDSKLFCGAIDLQKHEHQTEHPATWKRFAAES